MTSRYVWTKPQDLGIKPAKKPVEGFSLSGVVLVYEGGVGLSYISFDQRTVLRLGKKMPYGIGPYAEAFIKVVWRQVDYDVICEYVDKSRSVALWKCSSLPNWVQYVKYA